MACSAPPIHLCLRSTRPTTLCRRSPIFRTKLPRTITLTPAANQFGSATITVTVSDGSSTASDTFVLTVTSVNDLPTISHTTDRTINEDTSTGAISFTIGDVETAAGR